jgi:hypothetical protein
VSLEVAGAKTGFALFGTRSATIELLFRLYRDDTAPFTTDFTESFTNRMQLVDAAGNAFVVFPVPNTDDFHVGGRGELTPAEGYIPIVGPISQARSLFSFIDREKKRRRGDT